MISLGFYSFGRGGTGKTTLAVASTVLASLAGWRTLLVDIGDANNSSATRLLQSLEPPFTGDVLSGAASWQDAVAEARLKGGSMDASFYIIPSNGKLPAQPGFEPVFEMLSELRQMNAIDLVVFDLPSDPLGVFVPLVSKLDFAAVVATPEYSSVKVVTSNRLPAFTLPVLNKYRPELRHYYSSLRQFFGTCFAVSYDKNLEDLAPSNIGRKLAALHRETHSQLVSMLNAVLSRAEVATA